MLLLSGAMCDAAGRQANQPQVRCADRRYLTSLATGCDDRSSHSPNLRVLETSNPTGSELGILGLERRLVVDLTKLSRCKHRILRVVWTWCVVVLHRSHVPLLSCVMGLFVSAGRGSVLIDTG